MTPLGAPLPDDHPDPVVEDRVPRTILEGTAGETGTDFLEAPVRAVTRE